MSIFAMLKKCSFFRGYLIYWDASWPSQKASGNEDIDSLQTKMHLVLFQEHLTEGLSLGFQTLCEEVFGPKNRTQKTF